MFVDHYNEIQQYAELSLVEAISEKVKLKPRERKIQKQELESKSYLQKNY